MMIEITDSKAHEMAEHAEKVLKHGGKLMQCIEELCEDSRMGERGGYGRYGNRMDGGRYRSRYGMRDEEMRDEDYDRMGERYPRDWDEPYMGERHYRSASTGRYVRR